MNARSRSRASVQPRLRTRLRELTSDAILEAAERVFGRLGSAAGMDAIAAEAGVAVGTLYNHFRDRDTLVDALVEARAAALLERVQAALAGSETLEFRARLERVLDAVLASTSPNPHFRQVFLQAELRKPIRSAIVERVRGVLAPVFEQGRRAGELRPDPYKLQAAFLLGQLHTALVFSFESPDVLPRERIAAVVVDQFLHGAGGSRR
jgi:AcrR family transcriptional regulator